MQSLKILKTYTRCMAHMGPQEICTASSNDINVSLLLHRLSHVPPATSCQFIVKTAVHYMTLYAQVRYLAQVLGAGIFCTASSKCPAASFS